MGSARHCLDSESTKGLESRFRDVDSNLESNATESKFAIQEQQGGEVSLMRCGSEATKSQRVNCDFARGDAGILLDVNEQVAPKQSAIYRLSSAVASKAKQKETSQDSQPLDSITPRIIALKLSTNKGHQNALLAGLEYASKRCDCAISIDCDLQQDEQKLDEFIQQYKNGADIVMGIRNDRNTDTIFKKYTALGFYKLMAIMGVKLTKNHADYRLLSKKALDALLAHKESNLFLRGIIDNMGFVKASVYFDVKPRSAGESKYPLRKMLSFAWNGITSFSVMPLRLVSVLGFVFFMLSLGIGGYALYIKLFTDNAMWGWASTLIPLSFFSGIQLLSLGIIGEYIGKIYSESKHRPRYFIEKVKKSK